MFLSWIISSYIISSRKKEYKQEIYARVERIFNNKLIVCSGVNYKVEGELKRVQKPTKSNRSSYLDSDKLQYEDDFKKNIVEKFYYNLGGFNYKKLKKIENGYELEHISSRDLDYKSLNRYRPSIQDAYNKAYDFILKKNAGCHLPGIYDIISNFEYLHNNYYEIRNVAKPSRPFVKPKQRWENYFDYGSQILHYVTYSGYYEITERYSMIKEDYIKLYSLTGGLSFLIFTLLLSINPLKW